MNQPDITINVTAHAEGLLLHKTLRSVLACYLYAQKKGIKNIEFNLSVDNNTVETTRIADIFCAENQFVKLYKVSFGDLAEHRNFLVNKSSGKYIAFFDGDDLFTENYLYEAYILAEKNLQPAVYSPEYLLSFQDQNYITQKYASHDARFHTINLFEYNYFISQSFVHSEIYKKITYRPNTGGYGMEDWDWNNRVINAGFGFINVPHTIFCYRRRKNGLLAGQVANTAALRPSALLEPHNFIRFKYYDDAKHITHITQKPNIARESLRIIAKGVTLGTDTGYNYLQEQYRVNRNFAGQIRKVAKNKFSANPIATEPLDLSINVVPEHLRAIGVDDDLISLWKKLNNIEPLIVPSVHNLRNFSVVEYPKTSEISKKYYKLCKTYGNNIFDDMVLVPHIVQGGADLAAINLVKTIAREVKTNIFVFTTSELQSPLASELSKLQNVVLIELKDYLKDIDHSTRLIFLLRILQNWGIKRLNIINSGLGYDLLETYGRVIKENTKVYLHTYAFDRHDDGLIYNYLSNGLVKVYDFVDLFITDSETYKQQLIDINGFDASRIEPLLLPIESHTVNKPTNHETEIKRKVLWASRVSSAKLVEVAVEVGKELDRYDIELHFYGVLDHEYAQNDYFRNLIQPYNNIYYHGTYNGFESIDYQNYDMLLLTSKNEGMPNIILEALAANMFIVGPKVGGIPEVIQDGVNGFLVESNFTHHEYLEKILKFYNTEIDRDKLVALDTQITNMHSPIAYEHTVKKLLSI